MKAKLFFLGLLFAGIVSAQEEFSFQLYFEDAAGNRDTITLGYDPLATDTIDIAFGEENLINQPWNDSVLDVRITDKMLHILYGQSELETYHTKKQIVESYCMATSWEGRRVFVDVKNAVFPITMSFDTQLYQDSCVNGSTMDVLDPELHIDPVEGPPEYFFDYIFYNKNWNNGHYTPFARNVSDDRELIYKDIDGQYIFTYLITLQDKRFPTLNSKYIVKDNFQIYPNPFLESFEIQSDLPISDVEITNIRGEKINFEQNGNVIYLKECEFGMYIVTFSVNEVKYNYKILKE